MDKTEFAATAERRPCWVNGRRAMFHRWTDSARPVKPKGMEDEDALDRYQLHSVHGLVEYEDGHMERVWPNTIQFADGGDFTAYDWESMEANRTDPEPGPAAKPQATGFLARARAAASVFAPSRKAEEPARHCYNCKHSPTDTEPCEAVNYDCSRCARVGNVDCICQRCDYKSMWEADV